jgi:putative transcriptional regulator
MSFFRMNCKLNNRLAECLIAKEIKKSQLAYRFRLSRAHVTRLVRGEVQPSLGLALRLARYFGKPVEQIFQLAAEDHQGNFPSVAGSGPEQQTPPEITIKGKGKT